jgi:hypothetical protein
MMRNLATPLLRMMEEWKIGVPDTSAAGEDEN